VALVILGAPLANWGSSILLTRYIAQDRKKSRALWATALMQTGTIGSLLVVGTLAFTTLVLQERLALGSMLLIAVSELILLPAAHAATSQCYALERLYASAVSICLVPLGRILIVIGTVSSEFTGNPENAAAAHFIGSALGLLAATALVTRIDGLPAWRSRLPFRDAIRQGSGYALSNAVNTGYQEIDKILMLQLLGPAVAGPYIVAFRIASIFTLPISALISATLPRLMIQKGVANTLRTYRMVQLVALGYGALAGTAMLITAPIVPYLFGSDYAKATEYLSLLAPWPILFALHQCLATKLTASDHQYFRTTVETIGFLSAAALNILLLPQIGETASAFSLLATEAMISIMLWIFINKKKNTTL
tara:strand:- start:10272 stop:11366 length:1095 start_codon:yes stop_codon:yes gene_type:complete